MMVILHELIQFIWKNLLGIIIWLWMFWVTLSIAGNFERLDKIEMRQEAIENILKTYKPSNKPMDSLPSNPIPLDTISGNSDGWKAYLGFVKIIKGL